MYVWQGDPIVYLGGGGRGGRGSPNFNAYDQVRVIHR
jgi:hypothetical protein